MGDFDYIVNYMLFIVEEVCEYMVVLGFKIFDEMIGCIDVFYVSEWVKVYWKVSQFDLFIFFYQFEGV